MGFFIEMREDVWRKGSWCSKHYLVQRIWMKMIHKYVFKYVTFFYVLSRNKFKCQRWSKGNWKVLKNHLLLVLVSFMMTIDKNTNLE